MPIVAKATDGKTFDPVPQDIHRAVCYSVVDIGTTYDERYKKEKRQIVITWELIDERIDLEREGETVNLPRAISETYTLSLGDRANLRKMLQSWRGKDFTEQELQGFDLKNILGVPCQVQVMHRKKPDGRVFAKVENVLPWPKRDEVPNGTENELMYFSLDDVCKAELPSVPQWVQKRIMESYEWKELGGTQETTEPKQETVITPDGDAADEENLPF
jgi:hypothetical protein